MMQKLPIKIALPDAFFQQEEKCEYMVSADMKKVWAVELDLLQEFIRVCTKYNLRWFVGFGTLLGTIRHKGFIPWDDDIDVIMPRDDFNKLIRIGADAFRHPYFFQTPITENGKYFRTHPHLRNSLTTGTPSGDADKDINRGIFMDIFVLDEILLDEIEAHRRCLNKTKGIGLAVTSYPNLDCSLRKKITRVIKHYVYKPFYNPQNCFMRFHQEAAKFKGANSPIVAETSLLYSDRTIWNSSDWDNFELKSFETLQVRVPVGYHNILTKLYGDYMTPDSSAQNLHGGLIINPYLSYQEYFKR